MLLELQVEVVGFEIMEVTDGAPDVTDVAASEPVARKMQQRNRMKRVCRETLDMAEAFLVAFVAVQACSPSSDCLHEEYLRG